ncbi:hypothetical protein [Sphingomonas sp. ID0503]|uniref:hypothetical protein n=1 Tax=Sphingomonas sp. ID0503 TaxID=3399691 RepID=UPI003AFB032C
MDDLRQLHLQAAAQIEDSMREVRRRQQNIADNAERQLQQADDAVNSLIEEIELFDEELPGDRELRVVAIGGPAGTMLFPDGIMALGSDRIRFSGTDGEGCRVVIVQHVSQLNFMIKTVEVTEPARRIGFHAENG